MNIYVVIGLCVAAFLIAVAAALGFVDQPDPPPPTPEGNPPESGADQLTREVQAWLRTQREESS